MRLLLAPDRFAGSLTAAEAADAIATGWARSAPYDAVDVLPLSDGGPGFLDVLQDALGGEAQVVTARGPHGDPVPARVLVVDAASARAGADDGPTAYVEAAEVVGLHLAPPAGGSDPLSGTTAGVADLVLAAVDTGARRVVVGVGGTGTTDGGRGLVEALGGPDAARDRLGAVELVAATATDAPLMGHSGAAHGFAAAKGADRAARDVLEDRLRRWATDTDGGLAVRPGAGAGGGLGFGLLLVGAARVSGTALVADAAGLADRVAVADLAVTGQAVFDWEALRGRVIVAVARAAQQAGRPTVVLAQRVEVGRRELGSAGVDAAYAVEDVTAPDGEESHTPGELLALLAQRVARTWSR